MKRIKPAILTFSVFFLGFSAEAATQKVTLTVPTMDCATCPITIKAALKKIAGVSSAKVSYERREAVVVFDDSKTTVAELKQATSDAGYPSFLKDAPK